MIKKRQKITKDFVVNTLKPITKETK